MAKHKQPTLSPEQARAVARAVKDCTDQRTTLALLGICAGGRISSPLAGLKLSKADVALVLRELLALRAA